MAGFRWAREVGDSDLVPDMGSVALERGRRVEGRLVAGGGTNS